MNTTGYINSQLKIIEEWRKIDTEIGLTSLAVLFTVAQDEGMSITELAKKLSTTVANVSRHIKHLSNDKRVSTKNYGLLEVRYDEYEQRRKVINLSKKGRDLIKKLSDYVR